MISDISILKRIQSNQVLWSTPSKKFLNTSVSQWGLMVLAIFESKKQMLSWSNTYDQYFQENIYHKVWRLLNQLQLSIFSFETLCINQFSEENYDHKTLKRKFN